MPVLSHVAIIPDGNRRWARKKGLPAFAGHRRGFETLVKISREARKIGIKILTIWGFSTENWQRTKKEVDYLMKLYSRMIDQLLPEAKQDGIKIIHLGRKDRLPLFLQQKIAAAEKETRTNQHYVLNIALDYGGRDEICRAIKSWRAKHLRGVHSATSEVNLTEQSFSRFLDTAGQPDPDLIIRTSGEKRLSGFMLWQAAYSELYFTDLFMPDFGPQEFRKAIEDYSQRQRRFGK